MSSATTLARERTYDATTSAGSRISSTLVQRADPVARQLRDRGGGSCASGSRRRPTGAVSSATTGRQSVSPGGDHLVAAGMVEAGLRRGSRRRAARRRPGSPAGSPRPASVRWRCCAARPQASRTARPVTARARPATSRAPGRAYSACSRSTIGPRWPVPIRRPSTVCTGTTPGERPGHERLVGAVDVGQAEQLLAALGIPASRADAQHVRPGDPAEAVRRRSTSTPRHVVRRRSASSCRSRRSRAGRASAPRPRRPCRPGCTR